MPVTKSALLRYKIIDRTLRNRHKPYPTVEELRQACEDALFNSTGERISKSSIEKDLSAMRNDDVLGYEAPIRFDKKRNGYCYDDPDYSIQELPLKDEELHAILFAASTLYQYKDIPFFMDFYSSIEKIFSRVAISENYKSTDYSKLIQFEKEIVEVQHGHLPLLMDAVLNQSPVSFRYVKFGSKKAVSYNVWPLLLKEYRNRWYLTCFMPASKAILIFGIDRMHDLKMEKGSFKRPKEFDPEEYFKYSFGITSFNNTPPAKVVLSFTPSEGDYIRTKPLHASQTILADNRKEFRVELKVQLSYELTSMIFGYGALVKVVGPPELVRRIKESIDTVKKIYQRK